MKVIRNFKTLCLSVVLIVGVCSVGFGQAWEKVINRNVHYFPFILQLNNGNYCIFKHTFSSDQKQTISIYDANGNEKSTKTLTTNASRNIIPIDNVGFVTFSTDWDNFDGYIQKLDNEGNILWTKTTGSVNTNGLLVMSPNNDILLLNHTSMNSFDGEGNLKWTKNYENVYEFKSILYKDSQKIIALARKTISPTETWTYSITLDYNGKIQNEELIEKNENIRIRRYSNGDFLILKEDLANDTKIYRLRNSVKLWEKKLIPKNNVFINDISTIRLDSKGNIILGGSEFSTEANFKKGGYSNAKLTLLDSLGNLKGQKLFGRLGYNNFASVIETNDGYYLAAGALNYDSPGYKSHDSTAKSIFVKTKIDELYNQVTGQIAFDENLNCKVDSFEVKPKNWVIEAQNENGNKTYSIADNKGYYKVYSSAGKNTLVVKNQSPYISQLCDNTINVSNSPNAATLDLLVEKTADCPYLNVDIANFALRPCFDAVQVVNFCNHGSATAQNAYVEVKLDVNLTYLSSTKTAIAKGNNLYRFELGNIPTDSCGTFRITTKMACDNSLLGKTLCNTAHIYPDSLCAPSDNGKIQVTGTCTGATIKFDIKNEGTTPMNANKNYIIIEDHVMYMQGNFKLNPNEVKPIVVATTAGKTYRLIAEQTNPIYGNLASVAFENCNVSTTPSTGFINQFSQGDDAPFEDTDCRVVTASYDPNDKQAVPEGVQNQHFIAKNTDLEYMIRFQNKGTDTAFFVIVKDTLSQFLDPATIVPGASSHPYKFDLTDSGIAKFIFPGINLPHEKADKEGSNGFVKFHIKQRRDVPNGTVIKNRAAIYFDYNDPIITNETFHTIGENWAMILPNREVATEMLDVKIFPNPFNESTRIEAQLSEEHNNLIFNLLDSSGRVIRSENFSGNALDFQRNGLQSGFYFYEIKSDNKRLGTGKLLIFN